MAVLHKELEYKVEKLKNKKVGGHAVKSNPNFQLVNQQNHPGSAHTKFYRRDWLIQSIIYQ